MLGQATSVQHMCRSRWFSTAAIALLLLAAAQPGDVITLAVTCRYAPAPNRPTVDTTTSCDFVVGSSVTLRDRPVYLAKGWQQTYRRPDGSTYLYTDNAANGVFVRTFADMDGEVKLVDGIQTSDGRVMVNGHLHERVGPPGG